MQASHKIMAFQLVRTTLISWIVECLIKAISETLQESILVDMKNCRFLAYLPDGLPDAGIKEQEIVYCCYVKKDNPVTKFLGM